MLVFLHNLVNLVYYIKSFMKKITYLLLPLIGLSICSCNNYSSHYKSILSITNEHGGEGSLSFAEFEGQYVFKLKKTTQGEGSIKYSASLKEGHVDVYYVDPISKQELSMFSINSGETLDSYAGYVEKGYRVIIIVKSEGRVYDGRFAFNID